MTAKGDAEFVRMAIELAIEGMNTNCGGPFGAVVVRHGQVVGQGANQVTSTNDPTAHAEVVAIRDACKNLGSFQLTDCVVYSSCEPCPMCLGAIYWARPDRLVFAASKEIAAQSGFDDAFIYKEISVPFGSRNIPTLQLLEDEGARPFSEWQDKVDRIRY